MSADLVTVPDLIRTQARRSPAAVAVESAGDRLTYAQLVAQAGSLADHLRRVGVRPDDLVAVAVPRGVDLVPALLGVQLCGAAYLPLDPEHPADRLNDILQDAGARVLVTADAPGATGLRAEVRVHLDDVAIGSDPAELPSVRADSGAYVVYTSGSTGRPKGVLVTHRAFANFIASMRECPGLPDGIALPAVTTVAFDIAGLELFLPLTSGGRVVVARQGETNDPHRLAALLDRSGAKAMQATPVTWRLLLEAGWAPPPGFTVLCGGERLPAGVAGRLQGEGVVLWDLYGPTETTVWSATTRYHRGAPAAFHPVRDTQLHVLDDRLAPVADDAAGELYIGGAGLAVGYLGRPGQTAERFIADPFNPAGGSRLYRTGDVARRHPDGRIEIVGRSDDQVKIRGFRIEPGEVEHLLAGHPGVAEAAVRAITDNGATRLVGYLRPVDPADPPDPQRLRLRLARSVPSHLVPSQLVVLDAFPVTPNGKLDRSALPAPDPPGQGPVPAGQPPRDQEPDGHLGGQIERRVAEVLAGVLERAEIGPHEDFFALGGDSLRAVQAILRLNAELNRQVPINALFEARTAYGLALLLDDEGAAEPPLVPLAEGVVPRLSSAQWRLWLHQQRVPDSTADNHPLAVRLPDPLDLPALEAAVTGLLARHDILRTRYEYDDSGQPIPVVLPIPEVRLEVEQEDPAVVLATELALPFDLTTQSPVRLRLVRDPVADATILLLVLHDIAADDRSRELIANQVRAAYRGRTISPPALRYADYAEWQRQVAASPAAQRHLDFWRTALAGLEQSDLLTDRPRPLGRDWHAGTVRFTVSPEVVSALSEVAFEHDSTASTALLAGFFGVLSRYCTGSDLTVGVPVTGRRRAELEDLVGRCEDTAVIRVDVGGHPTFRHLLTSVRHAALTVQDHAVVPFEDIVAAVLDVVATRPEPGRNPLFDAMFAPHGIAAGSAGFTLPHSLETKFDLCCHLADRVDGGVDGWFEYATQLFDEATIARLASDYVRLLEQVAEHPARPLAQVPLLHPA